MLFDTLRLDLKSS